MNVLITGGAGYLGSVLAPHLLSKGHKVRVLDSLLHGGDSLLGVWSHPGFEFVRGDIRDAAAVRGALKDVEAVVHLAAIVGDPFCARRPEEARAVNHRASLDMFQQAQEQGVKRFLFASTCSNYGKMKDADSLLDETADLSPVSLYAESKVSVEKALMASDGPVAVTCLRFSTLYGVSPRMRFDLTVNEFPMEMFIRKSLVVFGETFWRPYVHVRDAAAALRTVLESPQEKARGQVFNVGASDQNFQKIQLVEMIRPLVPEAEVKYVKKQEDPRDYRVSFEKIRSVLGFRITRTVEDGIREVLNLLRSGVVTDVDSPRYRN